VLTVTALTDGEYVLSSVALGIDEYDAGVGEAPGVWSGGWSVERGVDGMVEADALRAVIDGNHPLTGQALLVGFTGAVGEGVRFDVFGAEVGVAAVGAGLGAGRGHGHGRPS
jgi:hypothetical protein